MISADPFDFASELEEAERQKAIFDQQERAKLEPKYTPAEHCLYCFEDGGFEGTSRLFCNDNCAKGHARQVAANGK